MTNVEIARRFAGISVSEFARRLGSSQSYASQLLHGKRASVNSIKACAAALDVSPAWLLGVSDVMAVMDPKTGRPVIGHIMRSEIVDDGGVLMHIYVDETGEIVSVKCEGCAVRSE